MYITKTDGVYKLWSDRRILLLKTRSLEKLNQYLRQRISKETSKTIYISS